MAKFIATVQIERLPGGGIRPIIPSPSGLHVPGDSSVNAMCYMDGGKKKGGFEGWVGNELQRVENDLNATTADVYLWAADVKLVKMSKEGAPGNRPFNIGQLISEKAKNKKNSLPADNNGD